MFSFSLPRFAALVVSLPTGGQTLMLHVGDGKFVSKVPPIVLAGVSPEPMAQVEGLPVGWDGTTLPGNVEAHPTAFVFDVAAAQSAVEAAAASGDTYAQMVMAELRAAEQVLDARTALGVMDAAPAAAPLPPIVDPVDAAAAEGVGSGA